MDEQKKAWEEPQLIVLTRGTPEESVLTHCKLIDTIISGALSITQDGCNDPADKNCGACNSRSGS